MSITPYPQSTNGLIILLLLLPVKEQFIQQFMCDISVQVQIEHVSVLCAVYKSRGPLEMKSRFIRSVYAELIVYSHLKGQ